MLAAACAKHSLHPDTPNGFSSFYKLHAQALSWPSKLCKCRGMHTVSQPPPTASHPLFVASAALTRCLMLAQCCGHYAQKCTNC